MGYPEEGSYDVQRFGVLHCAEYDHSGSKVATASADGVVRIWSTQTQELLSELRHHRAAVWCLSWSTSRQMPPTLASSAADGSIVIWRESRPREWQVVHQLTMNGPVAVVAFAPSEHGVILAAAASSGEVQLCIRKEVAVSPVMPVGEQWISKSFFAHTGGVVALSWAPSTSPAVLATGPSAAKAASRAPRQLVTAGADGTVRTWLQDEKDKTESWTQQSQLPSDQLIGGLRDVTWRPNVGIPSSVVAACTDSGSVAIWSQEVGGSRDWKLQTCLSVGGDARRLSWSKAGLLLGVSVGDDGMQLYRESSPGCWLLVTANID